jgi:hypothetical protein
VASNYPPGVTGFETQIECAEFDKTEERQVDLETYYDRHSVYETWSWSCPVCNSRATFDREYDQD